MTLPVWKGIIQFQGGLAAQIDCRDLGPTLKSLSLTLLLASGWPVLIGFVGWRLDHAAAAIPFVHAVAAGLLRAAIFAYPLEVLRIVCLRGGLAERHFDWPTNSVEGWKRNLTWFLPISVLLIGAVGLIEGAADEHRLDSIGRMTFLAFAALSGLFSLMTIRRSRTPVAASDGDTASEADAWSARFWQFAPTFAVAVCAGLFCSGMVGILLHGVAVDLAISTDRLAGRRPAAGPRRRSTLDRAGTAADGSAARRGIAVHYASGT